MKILIDLDCTLTDTPRAYFNYYREVANDFSMVYSENQVTWNMKNLCPLWDTLEKSENAFIQEGFFKHLNLYPNSKEILHRLKADGHYLHIVSCHNLKGADYKINWINKNLPMIDEITIIPIENGEQLFDKSSVEGKILIDDKVDALDSVNTKYKILYGSYPWNKDCVKYPRVLNWNEVYELIKRIGGK